MNNRFITLSVALSLLSGTTFAVNEQASGEQTNTKAVVRPVMHQEMAKALMDQLKIEMESAYLYLGISTYFAEQGLDGFAHWFSHHAEEEWSHAMKVHQFLLDKGVRVELPELASPATQWDSPIAAVEESLTHEISVSQAIKREYELALELKEYDVAEFLHWFLHEQIEEENLFETVLNSLYLIEGAHPAALLALDLEMAKRS